MESTSLKMETKKCLPSDTGDHADSTVQSNKRAHDSGDESSPRAKHPRSASPEDATKHDTCVKEEKSDSTDVSQSTVPKENDIQPALVDGPVPASVLDKGIAVGARLAVTWEIADSETGQGKPAVFTCTISDYKGLDPQGRPIFVATYDAQLGFPESSRDVRFDLSGAMWDMEDEDDLCWAHEGQEETLTLKEFLASEEGDDGQDVEVLEENVMSEFNRLPRDQQTTLAYGFREFADFMKEKLKSLCDQNGSDYVVTEDDITRLVQQFHGKKEALKGSG